MNIATRFPDTAQSRRFAVIEAFDQARVEEQRARAAKDDFAKRIFSKNLPADSDRILKRLDTDLEQAIVQKRTILDILLNTRDDIRTEADVTTEMERAVGELTASDADGDPNEEHRQRSSDVCHGVRRI
jgi:hypothetical protein